MEPDRTHRTQRRAMTVRSAPSSALMLASGLALMWGMESLDQFVLDEQLDSHGIVPRELDGLTGIVFAPFLHLGFAHLMANTVPLLVLGGLLAIKGAARFVQVTMGVILLGGIGVWLFGRTAVHLGASGLVFGYLGYLVSAGVFERRMRSVLLGIVAVVLYGGLVWGALPNNPGISWESHLFGLVAGAFMGWFVSRPGRRRVP
ncbi:MAG: rhomboid family intramembrane serine protease [Acidimicrobiales bacterium]